MSRHDVVLMLTLLVVSLLSYTQGYSTTVAPEQPKGTSMIPYLKSAGKSNSRTSTPENDVSFLVRLSSSITQGPSSKHVLKSPVIQNNGNAYSTTKGEFTAPVSGTYLFHVSAMAKAQIHVDIVMNGKLLATAWGSRTAQGSNMAVVHMHLGQIVWVRLRGNRHLSTADIQFTGTLLHKD